MMGGLNTVNINRVTGKEITTYYQVRRKTPSFRREDVNTITLVALPASDSGFQTMRLIESDVRDVISGKNVTIVKPANIYECELQDDVFIGPFVEIQKGCVIGCGSRVQSHTFICENVTIGAHCFIGHNVTFANDLFRTGRPDPSSESWIAITLEDFVTVGSGATILTPFICRGAVIGAGSVVIKPVEKKGIYAGNPARLIREL